MRHVDLHLAVGRGRRGCRRLLSSLHRVFLLMRAGLLHRRFDITVKSEELAVVLSQADVQGSRATLSEERGTLQIRAKSGSVLVDNSYLMTNSGFTSISNPVCKTYYIIL